MRFYIFLMLCCCLLLQQTQSQEQIEDEKIKSWLLELDNWPSSAAEKAAKNLYRQGKPVIPLLLLKLKEGSTAAKEACAECLSRMDSQEGFQAILNVAQEKEMRGRILKLFGALIRIDKDRAYQSILEFLKSPTQTSRYPAFQALAAITKAKHLPLLEQAFSSKYYGTRQYVIELVARIGNEKAIDFVILALDDRAVQVAYKAVEALGSMNNDSVRKRLFDLGHNKNKRLLGYTILALTMQEDNFNKELLSGYWLTQLLLLLRHDEPFVRTAAAIGLVNVGFRTDDNEIIKIMDKQLTPILIESIMGKVYFQDYVAVRKIGHQKLKQLTGNDFGFSGEQWWAWWYSNSGRFHAVRLLKGVAMEDIDNASISYEKIGGEGIRKVVLITDPDKAKNYKGYDFVVILDAEDMISYLNHLKEVDFFNLKTTYGLKLSHSTTSHTLKIKVKHLEKEIVSYQKNGGVIEPMIKNVEKLAKSNIWQQYWDNHRYPNWLNWYRIHKDVFRSLENQEDKNNKLKEMIVNSYGWLKPKERAEGAKLFLELMEKDNRLTDGMADLVVLHIRTELGINESSEALIRGVAYTKKGFVITVLAEYLLENYSLRARTLVLFLLKHGERKIVLSYLKHSKPVMRSMAAESLADFSANEVTELYLIGMLNDESLDVRKSAIHTLGELKAKNVAETLKEKLKNNSETEAVNSAMLKAIAKIDGEKAIPILLEKLTTSSSSTRITVAQALSEIPTQISIKTLIALMIGDTSREVRIVASGSLAQIGNDETTQELLKLANNSTMRSESRILALQTLQRYQAKNLNNSLHKLLKDKEEEVRIEAAFLLVSSWDQEAIPCLIEALNHPSYKFSATKHMTKLSFVIFEEGDTKRQYLDWWQENKNLPQKQWFFHALRKKKYDVTPMLDYLIGEKNVATLAPLLLEVLADEDWYLQAGACYILENLTGQNFGNIEFHTGQSTREKIVNDWFSWFEVQKNNGR